MPSSLTLPKSAQRAGRRVPSITTLILSGGGRRLHDPVPPFLLAALLCMLIDSPRAGHYKDDCGRRQHGSLLTRRRCKCTCPASAVSGRERAPHQRAPPADARGCPAPVQVQHQQARRPGQLAVAGAALPGRPRQRRRQRDAALPGLEACARHQAAIVLSAKHGMHVHAFKSHLS